MAEEKRLTYRGVTLPEGVTPAIAQQFEALFDDWCGDARYVCGLPDAASLLARVWPMLEKASRSRSEMTRRSCSGSGRMAKSPKKPEIKDEPGAAERFAEIVHKALRTPPKRKVAGRNGPATRSEKSDKPSKRPKALG